MKLHSEHPGKDILATIVNSVEIYEAKQGKKPACIELTQDEVSTLQSYLKDSLQYLLDGEEWKVYGVPIFVTQGG